MNSTPETDDLTRATEFAQQLERERDRLKNLHNENAAHTAELLQLCGTLQKERDRLAEALERALNATVLNHRNDRWHMDAEHTLQLIKTQ